MKGVLKGKMMIILLILSACIFYIGYTAEITEQENITHKHEDAINKLNNEIKELKEQEREIER